MVFLGVKVSTLEMLQNEEFFYRKQEMILLVVWSADRTFIWMDSVPGSENSNLRVPYWKSCYGSTVKGSC
ncbi:hypothetical protein Pcinc_010458 [Petrolisthes cinctipes]|uniref:Uncharacterized protein n=1 Tax=Petrolisthes cinctipes TaxID=88211 RepID=A0AAE1G3A5_PETCI|nr:hypothetical protein Pcinc_010458 [Petrolisthes cinctipes]